MSQPVITILMPARNAAPYIGDAIRSVLNQTFSQFELLIIDDGSTDDTVDIARQFSDRRIRIISQEPEGVSAALNFGLQESSGEFIARFDADDICMPERLEKQLHFLRTNPDHVIVGSDAEYMSENGDHLFYFSCHGHTHEEISSKIYDHCPFIHSAVMYRKKAVMATGGYCPHTHNFEDYLLWIQLKKYGKYHNLPEPLIRVRFNPGSVTMDEKWRGNRFRKLKKQIIRRGYATETDGHHLKAILQKQDVHHIRQASYYALCGKKFLLNNHQPGKARKQFATSIKHYPLRLDNYVFYMLSFLPGSFINWLHRKTG